MSSTTTTQTPAPAPATTQTQPQSQQPSEPTVEQVVIPAVPAEFEPHGIVNENNVNPNEKKLILEESKEEDIADITQLVEELTEILEYVAQPAMIELRKNNFKAYEEHIEAKYAKFVEKHYGIFDMIIKQENTDIDKFIEMCIMMDKIKNGQSTMKEEYDKFSGKLNEEYIYPQFGGKENFEKVTAKKQQRKQRRQMKHGHK